ncbi:pimeloyl-ACP methyl ester carboxylesterase [Actinopolyspora lacussalsi]|nr:pimeloyl-ACP methyl ester carboxylesterase [Actinopolyspora lacussalsi]
MAVGAPEDFGSACVAAPDGALLPVRTAGDPDDPAVLLASACGMPAGLCDPWAGHLARDHYVLTWETRGMFGDERNGRTVCAAAEFDRLGTGVEHQVGDMLAVLDGYGIRDAHVMGLCGGAVLGLRMAADHPDRVTSLSLWHGDYELGADCPKTSHQRNLQALMEMAAESRDSAAMVQSTVRDTATDELPPEIAEMVRYPYRDSELLYRYCRLNGALMAHDVRGLLSRVEQPTLVVTSEDDHTAHPAGSHAVASGLPSAELYVAPHGNHLSLFAAGGELTEIAGRFLRERGG